MSRLIIVILASAVLVSCAGETVPEATTTTLPIVTSTSPVTSTGAPTTSSVPAIPEREGAIYLFFEGYPVEPGPYLVAVARPGVDDLEEALTALLDGESREEAAMGVSSTIPDGTSLLGVEVADGIASVDLSREFESGGGSLSMMGRVAQVVYTATGFDEVDAVLFLVEGVPVDVLGGEGLIIDEPQTRSDWVELVPEILVEEPRWGSTVGREILIAGIAELESGSVSYVIVDSEGFIVGEGEITTVPGQPGAFSTTIVLDDSARPGAGSIIAWEWAPDGSQRHVLDYPLTLAKG